jgi:hypothetical protein
MNRTTSLVVGVLLCAAPVLILAQVRNEGLANQIITARQKNSALLKQYNWNSLTTFFDNGEVRDTRIDSVTFGPDGGLQKAVINDQHASLPRGFLRHMAAENKMKETEKYLNGLHGILDQYTVVTPGAVINFLSQANIQTGTAPDGTPTLTAAGNNVINPGDSLTVTFNPTDFQPLSVQITTFYDGHAVNVSGTFKTIKGGPTHLQFATIDVPDKTMTLQVHNYDYIPND